MLEEFMQEAANKAEEEISKRLQTRETKQIVDQLKLIAGRIGDIAEGDEDSTYIRDNIGKLNIAARAALSPKLLAHPSVAPHIDVQVLKQIQKNAPNMTVEEYGAITNNLKDKGPAEVQDYLNYGGDSRRYANPGTRPRRTSETTLEGAQRRAQERQGQADQSQPSQPGTANDRNNNPNQPDSN